MKTTLIAGLMLLLTACAASIEDYRGSQPSLQLREYFNGNIKAYGLFQDYSGKVVRSFTVDLRGEWQGSTGTLHEQFEFDDGEKQTRIWTISELSPGQYRGVAGDVLGEAEGLTNGRALRWRYTLNVPVDGETYEFTFDDWMWQFDQKRLFNKAQMKKWGITVGEVTLFFEKQD